MIPYLDYPNMKEFYTIAEVCRLFKMEKKDLKHYSERFEIFPRGRVIAPHAEAVILRGDLKVEGGQAHPLLLGPPEGEPQVVLVGPPRRGCWGCSPPRPWCGG